MTWEILWALILGFGLSAVVQAVVRRSTIVGLLGSDRPQALAVAAGLGAASSSCSYAAVALARSLFRKGAGFTAAMIFEIASTNLVVELGVILALLIGWQFTLAEFVGGPIMIILVAVLFRLFLRRRLIDAARTQAGKGLAGSMEGHAGMDMTIGGDGSAWRRLRSPQAFTSISRIFVMEWGQRHARVLEASIQWNYTTVLNIVFLALAAALLFRFVRSGSVPMLRMMGGTPPAAKEQAEAG
jgi:hypothetical protein